MLQLPVDSEDKNYSFNSNIFGIDYKFHVYFNDRSRKWNVDMRLIDGTDVLLGITVLADSVLTDLEAENLPNAFLYASNVTNNKQGDTNAI